MIDEMAHLGFVSLARWSWCVALSLVAPLRPSMPVRLAWSMILGIMVAPGVCAAGTYLVTSIEAVSVSSAGEYGNGPSEAVAIGADGRFVAFVSEATNLVPGVAVPQNIGQYRNRQVYVRDLETHQTEIVSVDSNGQPVNGLAFQPSISSSGRFVAFVTDAQDVVPDLYAPPMQRVYIRDRELGQTRLVSKASNGYRFSQPAHSPVVMPDGSRVVFLSRGFSGENWGTGVFKHDLTTGKTFELQVLPGTSNPVKGFVQMEDSDISARVWGTEISTDNGAVAFVSHKQLPWLGRDLALNDPGPGNFDHPFIYLLWRGRDLLPASLPPTLNHGGTNTHPAVGGYDDHTNLVAFESDNPSWGPDSNRTTDIFVFRPYAYMSPSGSLHYFERVSVSAGGEEANGPSRNPAAAANLIAFESDASNLVSGDANGTTDIFLSGSHVLGDATLGLPRIVSKSRCGGKTANGTSTSPAVSLSGREVSVAFLSTASDLVWNPPSGPSPQAYVMHERWVTWPWEPLFPRLSRFVRCRILEVRGERPSHMP